MLRALSIPNHEAQGERLPRMEAEPVENPLEVMTDGMGAQPHPLGDVRVGESFRRK
jgi:hypothetical protein